MSRCCGGAHVRHPESAPRAARRGAPGSTTPARSWLRLASPAGTRVATSGMPRCCWSSVTGSLSLDILGTPASAGNVGEYPFWDPSPFTPALSGLVAVFHDAHEELIPFYDVQGRTVLTVEDEAVCCLALTDKLRDVKRIVYRSCGRVINFYSPSPGSRSICWSWICRCNSCDSSRWTS